MLVVNSARDPEYLLKFLPEPMLAKLDKLVVVDATGLAEQRGSSPWMFVRDLSELAFDRMSTEGAVERLAVGRGIAAPLIGALVAATGVLPVEAVAEEVADRDAMLRGAGSTRSSSTPPPEPSTSRRTLMSVRGTHVPDTSGCRSRASPRRPPRRKASGCSRPATSASTGRCTGTRHRRATTPARPASRSRSTWITSSTTATWTATSRSARTTRCPSVTGRVCYHPCETACNRAAHDEPIGIRGVERFLGDFGLKLADNPVKPGLPPLNGKTVAIVGSGPGGLGCAYHLRRTGYASVIFEALDQPGGMLRAGIPRLAPARGDPGRGDRQAAGPGRHRDPLRRPGGRRPRRGDARLSPDHL